MTTEPPEDRLVRPAPSPIQLRLRPGWPKEAVRAALEGVNPCRQVADIGAGTGLLALALAGEGVHVDAVEPSAAMRVQAPPHPNVFWFEGTGASSGLDGGVYDVVTCGQAFHWMHPEQALDEFRRLLRDGGRVALLWNVIDSRDRVTAAWQACLRSHATDPVRSPWTRPVGDVFADWDEFAHGRRLDFENVEALDLDALLGRACSTADLTIEGPAWEALRADISALHALYAVHGRIALRYRTEVHLAEAT